MCSLYQMENENMDVDKYLEKPRQLFLWIFFFIYFMHGNFTVYATLEQFLGGLHLASAILLLVSLNDVHVCMIYDRIKLCQE